MPNPSELYSIFSFFPSPEHVQTVCKPGQGSATCKYLSQYLGISEIHSFCRKASSLNKQVTADEKKRVVKTAQGDNCRGTLGFITDNQNLLTGNSMLLRNIGKNTKGVFNGITQINGKIEVGGITFIEDAVDITISSEGIVFSADENLSAKVLFTKPK